MERFTFCRTKPPGFSKRQLTSKGIIIQNILAVGLHEQFKVSVRASEIVLEALTSYQVKQRAFISDK